MLTAVPRSVSTRTSPTADPILGCRVGVVRAVGADALGP
jgi:hypothetical protein